MIAYISTIISGCSLLIVALTFIIARGKDRDSQKENNIRMNVKLDQLCGNVNQILLKFDRHDKEINDVKTELEVVKRDVKTAFNQIEDLKKEGKA